jgi:antitoxin (DNA-binding transcriptional repressor) of toxin-antitoxin stability system
MVQIDVRQAQEDFPRILDQVASGEIVLVCKDNEPIAEIRPVAARRGLPRPIGLAKGTFDVPASFFEPLPNDLLAAFQGESS